MLYFCLTHTGLSGSKVIFCGIKAQMDFARKAVQTLQQRWFLCRNGTEAMHELICRALFFLPK